MGIGQGNWLGMVFTVLFFYGAVILVSYFVTTKSINKTLHFLLFGLFGLFLEWIIFQENPFAGNLVIVILINFGMFMHWGLIAFAPRMLLDDFKYKRSFIGFYIIGMLAVLIIGGTNFSMLIIGNVLVYTVLYYWVHKYIKQA